MTCGRTAAGFPCCFDSQQQKLPATIVMKNHGGALFFANSVVRLVVKASVSGDSTRRL
jgi:hypothetical protein